MSIVRRCPFCLAEMSFEEHPEAGAEFACVRCARVFKFGDTVPVIEAKASTQQEPPPEIESASAVNHSIGSTLLWSSTLIIAAASCFATYYYGRTISGLEFLAYYGLSMIGIMALQWIIRMVWDDRYSVSIAALLLFESVGATRLLTGYFLFDMKKFSFLLILMTIGGFLQFARSDNTQFLFSGGGGCSAGGCGGGCGGGGCGGCGG